MNYRTRTTLEIIGATIIALIMIVGTFWLTWPTSPETTVATVAESKAATQGENAPQVAQHNQIPTPINPNSILTEEQFIIEMRKSWTEAEVAQHQAEVLNAYNCARRKKGMPEVRLDQVASEEAAHLWAGLSLRRGTVETLWPDEYPSMDTIPLDFAQPSTNCVLAGFDFTKIDHEAHLGTVGIALFPPPPNTEQEGAIAVLLGR